MRLCVWSVGEREDFTSAWRPAFAVGHIIMPGAPVASERIDSDTHPTLRRWINWTANIQQEEEGRRSKVRLLNPGTGLSQVWREAAGAGPIPAKREAALYASQASRLGPGSRASREPAIWFAQAQVRWYSERVRTTAKEATRCQISSGNPGYPPNPPRSITGTLKPNLSHNGYGPKRVARPQTAPRVVRVRPTPSGLWNTRK